jgi:hypothetical protein
VAECLTRTNRSSQSGVETAAANVTAYPQDGSVTEGFAGLTGLSTGSARAQSKLGAPRMTGLVVPLNRRVQIVAAGMATPA